MEAEVEAERERSPRVHAARSSSLGRRPFLGAQIVPSRSKGLWTGTQERVQSMQSTSEHSKEDLNDLSGRIEKLEAAMLQAKQQEGNLKNQVEFLSHDIKRVSKNDETTTELDGRFQTIREEYTLIEGHVAKVVEQKMQARLEFAGVATTAQMKAIQDEFAVLHTKCEGQQQGAEVHVHALAREVFSRLDAMDKSVNEQVQHAKVEHERQSKKKDEKLEALQRQLSAAAFEAKQQGENIQSEVQSLRDDTGHHLKKYDETIVELEKCLQTIRDEYISMEVRVNEVAEQKLLTQLQASAAITTASVQAIQAECGLLHTRCEKAQARTDAFASDVTARLEHTDKLLGEQVHCIATEIESRSKTCDESLEALKTQLSSLASETKQQNEQVKQQVESLSAEAKCQLGESDERGAALEASEKRLMARLESAAAATNAQLQALQVECGLLHKKCEQQQQEAAARSDKPRGLELGSKVASMQQSIQSLHSDFGQELSKLQSALVRTTQSQIDTRRTSEEAIADVLSKLGLVSRSMESKVSDQQLSAAVSSVEEQLRVVHGSQACVRELQQTLKSLNDTTCSLKGEVASGAAETQQLLAKVAKVEAAVSCCAIAQEVESNILDMQVVAQQKFAALEAGTASIREIVNGSVASQQLDTSIAGVREELLESCRAVSLKMSTFEDTFKQDVLNLKDTCAKHQQEQVSSRQHFEEVAQGLEARCVSKQQLGVVDTSMREQLLEVRRSVETDTMTLKQQLHDMGHTALRKVAEVEAKTISIQDMVANKVSQQQLEISGTSLREEVMESRRALGSEMATIKDDFKQQLSKLQSACTTTDDFKQQLSKLQSACTTQQEDQETSRQRFEEVVRRMVEGRASKQQLEASVTSMREEFLLWNGELTTIKDQTKSTQRLLEQSMASVESRTLNISNAQEDLITMVERCDQGTRQMQSKITDLQDSHDHAEQQLKVVVTTVNQQLRTVPDLVGQTVSQGSFASALSDMQNQLAAIKQLLDSTASQHELDSSMDAVDDTVKEMQHTLSLKISAIENLQQKSADECQYTMKQSAEEHMKRVNEQFDQIYALMDGKAREDKRILEQALENKTAQLSEQVQRNCVLLDEKTSKQEVVEMIEAIHNQLTPLGSAMGQMASKKQLEEFFADCQEQLVSFQKVLGSKASDCDIVGIRSVLGDNMYNMQSSMVSFQKTQKKLEEQLAAGLALIQRYEPVERALAEVQKRMSGMQEHFSRLMSIPVDQIVKSHAALEEQVCRITTLEDGWDEMASMLNSMAHIRDHWEGTICAFEERAKSTIHELSQKVSHQDVCAKVERLRDQVEAALEAAILSIQQDAEKAQIDIQSKVAELRDMQESQDSRFKPLESSVTSANEQTSALGEELKQKASREELAAGIDTFRSQVENTLGVAFADAQKQVETRMERSEAAAAQVTSQLRTGFAELQRQVWQLEDSAVQKERIDEIDTAVKVLEKLSAKALGM